MRIKKAKKIIFPLIFAGALVILMFSGCSQQAPEEPLPEPVVVAPTPPEPEPEPEPLPTLPLCGLEVQPDDPLLHQKPLSVKIENTPESRPSLGITHADVVYETITEGGITRFNAIFQSDVPEAIGSVRSARNSDITIVPQYDAIFVFSGTNSLVWADLGKTWINYMEEGTAGKALYRINYKAGPHNLYLNTDLAHSRAEERGYQWYQPWPKGLVFGDYDTSGLGDQNDAIEIFIPFSGSMFDVTWQYDPDSGKYLRFIKGVPQCDEGGDKSQIQADNVVMLSVPYVNAPAVPNKGQTYNLNFVGSGAAIVFRDGVRIDCTWNTDGTMPPTFTDMSGNPVPLKAGKTWFEVPRDITATVVTTGHPELDNPDAAVSQETDQAAVDQANAQDVNE